MKNKFIKRTNDYKEYIILSFENNHSLKNIIYKSNEVRTRFIGGYYGIRFILKIKYGK